MVSSNAGLPDLDLSRFLDSLPARPRLLGLGEPTHGIEDLLSVRNEVFRSLVTEHGYRAIAIESDCLAGVLADEFVAGGSGTTEEVLRTGFSHDFGRFAGNRELIDWLRVTNADRDPADRVRFYGFDAPMEMMGAQSPRASLLALHAYLSSHLDEVPGSAAEIAEHAGADERWDNQDAMLDAAHSIGGTASAVRLRLLADELSTLLFAESPQLAPAEPERFWLAGLHARSAVGLCRQHAMMAEEKPSRLQRMTAGRDVMMAENLLSIAARERDRGPVLVFAHNAHLQRPRASMQLGPWHVRWYSAGSLAARSLGTDYAHLAMDLGTSAALEVPPPAADTLAGVLATGSRDPRLFNSAELIAALGEKLSTMVDRTDTAGNYRYAPLALELLPHTDGVLFLPETGTQDNSRTGSGVLDTSSRGTKAMNNAPASAGTAKP